MKRMLTMLLVCVMALSLTVPVLAGQSYTISTYNVKWGATDVGDTCRAIAEDYFRDREYTLTVVPNDFSDTSASMSARIGDDVYKFELNVIYPVLQAKKIPDIAMDNPKAADRNTISDYIFEYRDLINTSDTYKNAWGTAPEFKLDRKVLTEYEPPCTITVEQQVAGQRIVQTCKVVGEIEPHQPQITEAYVKYNCVDLAAVWAGIAKDCLPDGYTNVSQAPTNLESDQYTMIVSWNEYNYYVTVFVVHPEFKTAKIPSIMSTDPENVSEQTLLEYIYKFNMLTQVNQEYENARGRAPVFKLEKYSAIGYEKSGKTYSLVQTYLGKEMRQSLIVVGAKPPVPYFYVDDKGIVYCNPDTVEYAMTANATQWTPIKYESTIGASLYGKTIYVRTPKSEYMAPSDPITYRIKGTQDQPEHALVLAATSFQVRVVNAYDYVDCEFSIDGGKTWDSQTVWNNRTPKTSYTVSVRQRATSIYFPSAIVSATITTAEGAITKLESSAKTINNFTYLTVNGTVKLDTASETVLTGAYTLKDLQDIRNEIVAAAQHYQVVTMLNVLIEAEENDIRNYTTTSFSMPDTNELGTVQLRLNAPQFIAVRDVKTTNITITTNPSDGAAYKLRSGASAVYKVTTRGDGGPTKIIFPWAIAQQEDLDSLTINYTPINGSGTRALKYLSSGGQIIFNLPGDGYFSITDFNRMYYMPFSDCYTTWAAPYIYYGYANQLVNGVGKGLFDPNGTVSRAQLLTLLARMTRGNTAIFNGLESQFKDVKTDAWYTQYINYLDAQGYLDYYASERLNPNTPVTREEVAYLVTRIFQYKGIIWQAGDYVDRGSIANYALNSVDILYTLGIMEGDDQHMFNPTSNLTRAELVAILYRVDKVLIQ